MRQLIEDNISLASTQRTVPVIVDASGRRIADEGWALYLAAQWLEDARWRYQSPSRIARFYGDLGWKRTDAEVQLVASEANNFFGVSEPTRAQLRAAKGRYSERWTVQSNGRAFGQGNPLFHTLCLESDGSPRSRRRMSKFSAPTTSRPSILPVAATLARPRHGGRSSAPSSTRSRPAAPWRRPRRRGDRRTIRAASQAHGMRGFRAFTLVIRTGSSASARGRYSASAPGGGAENSAVRRSPAAVSSAILPLRCTGGGRKPTSIENVSD